MTSFDPFRRPDGTIDLHQAWRITADPELTRLPAQRVQATQFFHRIEDHQPIQSRQIAALALATCHSLITQKAQKAEKAEKAQ